jgi:hypothetical protein
LALTVPTGSRSCLIRFIGRRPFAGRFLPSKDAPPGVIAPPALMNSLCFIVRIQIL